MKALHLECRKYITGNRRITILIHNVQDWCCHLYSSCSSKPHWEMIVLAYLGVSVQNFRQLGGCADIYILSFVVVYLA
jgi:hypothetical protein